MIDLQLKRIQDLYCAKYPSIIWMRSVCIECAMMKGDHAKQIIWHLSCHDAVLRKLEVSQKRVIGHVSCA